MASAVAARWELSRRLVNRRKRLGVNVKTIASTLEFTRNYWSAVENDRTLIAEDKLIALFDLLEFNETERIELLALRSLSRQRSWWDQYSDGTELETLRFLGLEDGANTIEAYASLLLPALLQTEAYARAILSFDPSVSQLRIDQMVEMRAMRQERVIDNPNVRYSALLSEAAIVQRWASIDDHIEQLGFMMELVDSGKVDIHVLPLGAPPGLIAAVSTLVLMTFPSEHLPNVFWQESVRPLSIVEEGNHNPYRHLATCLADGKKRGLDASESLALIEQQIAALQRHEWLPNRK